MIDAIVDGVRVSMMVAAALGAVVASILAVAVVLGFAWYARSVYRGE